MKHLAAAEKQTLAYYELHGEEWSAAHYSPDSWKKEIQLFKKLLPAGRIFEVGSGGGRDAKKLSALGYDYIGTDVSRTLIKIARRANPKLSFLHQSVYDLALPGKPRDGFWCAATLLHIPREKMAAALLAISKNLRRGALGLITVKKGRGEKMRHEEGGTRFFVYHSLHAFASLLEHNGFTIVKKYEKKVSPLVTWLVFFVEKAP